MIDPREYYETIVVGHLLSTLRLYIDAGVPTGGFLRAVLANDLNEAVGRADSENIHRLPAIVAWIYNEAPSPCHGSYAAVDSWLDRDWTEARSALAARTTT